MCQKITHSNHNQSELLMKRQDGARFPNSVPTFQRLLKKIKSHQTRKCFSNMSNFGAPVQTVTSVFLHFWSSAAKAHLLQGLMYCSFIEYHGCN